MAGTLIYAVAAGLWLLLPASVPAQADDVNCGDTITVDTVLQQDLDCELSAGGRGLTVQGPATLDLGGFDVACEGARGDSCIALVGSRARLRSGGVRTGLDLDRDDTSPTPAVRIAGEGGHTVQGIEASAGTLAIGTEDTSFVVESDGNRLQDNRAAGEAIAFSVEGDNNLLSDNTVTGSIDFSFNVLGANNRLQNNIIDGGETSSILVRGPNNFLISNQLSGGIGIGGDGIRLGPEAHFTTVQINTVTLPRQLHDVTFGIRVGSDHNLILFNLVQNPGPIETAFAVGIRLLEGATDNVVVGNQVIDATTDLVDDNRRCDKNIWLANVFETGNQPCVSLNLRRGPPRRPRSRSR